MIYKKTIITIMICVMCLGMNTPLSSHEITESTEWIGQIRIEGKNETIFSDEVTVGSITITAFNVDTNQTEEFIYDEPTALGALVEASLRAGFPYELQYYPSWDSIFVVSINDDSSWWHYYVDYDLLMVGISDFKLTEEHQSILFGYVENTYVHALQIDVDAQEIKKNEGLTITITDEGNGAVPDATIYLGEETYRTDQNGNATIVVSDPGTYNIYAEKDGYIRTEQLDIHVKKTKGKTFDLILRFLQDSPLIDILEKMMNKYSF